MKRECASEQMRRSPCLDMLLTKCEAAEGACGLPEKGCRPPVEGGVGPASASTAAAQGAG